MFIVLFALFHQGGNVYCDSEKSHILPRFEWAQIPEELKPEKGDVRFGYLSVPENRNNPENIKIIKLAVAILKSTSESPEKDPVLFTTGGPGVLSTVRAAKYFHKVAFIAEMMKDRDFILFEQRGAKYSIPNLLGPEIDHVFMSAIGVNLNGEPDMKELLRAGRKLKNRLEKEGIDLTAYNSTESAADIEDLRKVLHIKEWNLVGISYSCRLILEVLRRYPDGVRAVVLDGPLPPEANWNETSVENYWGVMTKLFARCRVDSNINAKYPDLENRFLRLLEEARHQPLAINTLHPATKRPVLVKVNDRGIFQSLCAYIGVTRRLQEFAQVMHNICNRNEFVMKHLIDMLISPKDISWGMAYSFWINEELPFEDFKKFAEHHDVPDQLRNMEFTAVPKEMYDIWPRRHPHPSENQPVQSQVPALILSGELDPDTPSSFTEMVAQHLPNSHLVVFKDKSHLQIFANPCGKVVVREFLNHPEEKPKVKCLQ
jgi:pimeloyl-ACP methyl ester carboxylesterase